ncbi:MAG: hypothetical protein ACLVJY_05655 [Frisingicoccus sp.]
MFIEWETAKGVSASGRNFSVGYRRPVRMGQAKNCRDEIGLRQRVSEVIFTKCF